MRLPFALILVGASAVLAPAADIPSLCGEWRIHYNVFGKERGQTGTFTREHGELKGTCTSDKVSEPVTGEADGKAVTWRMKTLYDGNLLTIEFTGAASSSTKIVGAVIVEH